MFDNDANNAALDLSEQERFDDLFSGGDDKDLLPRAKIYDDVDDSVE